MADKKPTSSGKIWIVDLAETLAGWEVATSARFPRLLWARFRALGKTVLYRRPACRILQRVEVGVRESDPAGQR